MPYTGTEYSHQKEAELSMANERWNDDHDNDVSFFGTALSELRQRKEGFWNNSQFETPRAT
jgi:hypothetical protein